MTLWADGIARQLWLWRWPLLLGLVIGSAAAVLFVLLSDRMYEAEVIAVPADHDEDLRGPFDLGSSLGDLGALAGIGMDRSDESKEAMALMRSRGFIEGFIADNDLLPVLFPSGEIAENGDVIVDGEVVSLWDGYEKFSEEVLSVQEDLNLGIIIVRVTWSDSAVAADWANGLIDRANRIIRERAMRDAEASLTFLRDELQSTGPVEIRQAIYRLIETQISKRMLAKVRPDYAFKVIDRAQPKDLDAYDYPLASLLIPAGAILGLMLALFLCAVRVLVAPTPPASE